MLALIKKVLVFLFVKLDRLIRKCIWTIQLNFLYKRALFTKECFYGPFLGEFGHLLGHNLPFVAHLYSLGVKVKFCGLGIHKPFFYSDNDVLIVNEFLEIRDFFSEYRPDCNTAQTPVDVTSVVHDFVVLAEKSKSTPFFDNRNSDYYFNFFRWWVLKNNYIKTYDLSKKYRTKYENSCVIFPRKWNADYTTNQLKNNGEVWDYERLAQDASKYFDKVYVMGHPVFSAANFESFGNVEVVLTDNNSEILEKCSNSKLIISQHSGSVYLGEYTDCQVLIIYKGGNVIGDIEITKKFKQGLGTKFDFAYAFDFDQINDYLMRFISRII